MHLFTHAEKICPKFCPFLWRTHALFGRLPCSSVIIMSFKWTSSACALQVPEKCIQVIMQWQGLFMEFDQISPPAWAFKTVLKSFIQMVWTVKNAQRCPHISIFHVSLSGHLDYASHLVSSNLSCLQASKPAAFEWELFSKQRAEIVNSIHSLHL